MNIIIILNYVLFKDEVRLAVLMPTDKWSNGGEGILGASVACGYLHSLPSKCCHSIGMSYEGSIKGNNDLQSPFSHYNDKQSNVIPLIDNDDPGISKIDSVTLPEQNSEQLIEQKLEHRQPGPTVNSIDTTDSQQSNHELDLNIKATENLVPTVNNPVTSKNNNSALSFGTVLSFFDGNPPSED